MTSHKGMDKLFQGRELEDVHNWVERLNMAIEVRGIDEQKLFKIGRLNLKGKSKRWYKKLVDGLIDQPTMKVTMLLKYGIVDKEEVQAKLDQIKQEPKQRVQAYHDKMEIFFTRGKMEDVEQRQ